MIAWLWLPTCFVRGIYKVQRWPKDRDNHKRMNQH